MEISYSTDEDAPNVIESLDVSTAPDYALPEVVEEPVVSRKKKVKKRRKKRVGLKTSRKEKGEMGVEVPALQTQQSALTLKKPALGEEYGFLFEDPVRMAVFQPGYYFEAAGLAEDELLEQAAPKTLKNVITELWDLNDKDNDYEFYKLTFVGKQHWNFLGAEIAGAGGPMAVSVIRTGDFFTAMVRTTRGCERREQVCSSMQEGALGKLLRRGPQPKTVLRSLCPELVDNRDLNNMEFYLSDPDAPDNRVPELLLTLHDRQRVTGFKFGVLYAARKQSKETEFFCNNETSPMFEEFVAFLGDRIELDGWEGFRGGMDVRSGSTGKYAVYTEYQPGNCPILFHISTYLPFETRNDQQLERKRHIGNDLVVIVFQDSSEAPFRPSEVSSRMIHVLIVIRPVKMKDRSDETWYRMSVISKDKTPAFGPVFEDNVAIFKKGKAFRELLLQKLLNAERAAYAAPILSTKMKKTRQLLLSDAIRQLKK